MYKILRPHRVINIYGKRGFCINSANLQKNKYSGLLNGLRELEKLEDRHSMVKVQIENQFGEKKRKFEDEMNRQLNWIENQKYNNFFNESEKKECNELLVNLIKKNNEKKIRKEEEEKDRELKKIDAEYWKKMEEQNEKIENIFPTSAKNKNENMPERGSKEYNILREKYEELEKKYKAELEYLNIYNKECYSEYKDEFDRIRFFLTIEGPEYEQIKGRYKILEKRYKELSSQNAKRKELNRRISYFCRLTGCVLIIIGIIMGIYLNEKGAVLASCVVSGILFFFSLV